MSRWIIATVFSVNACLSAMAQDMEPAAFPDDEPPVAVAEQPIKVNLKVLKKALGAKVVEWDDKSGILKLRYDFRKGQEKDWEISQRITAATAFKGIRVAAGDKITHKVPFSEATCVCKYSCQFRDTGSVISVGPGASVTTLRHGAERAVRLNLKEKNLGVVNLPPNGRDFIQIILEVTAGQVRLKMNGGAEVFDNREAAGCFQVMLYGGDNGGEFGELTISGKPDPAWLKSL